MNYLLAFLLLAGCLSTRFARAQAPARPLEKYYLDSTFTILPSEVGAVYRREVEYGDSTSGVQRDYFLSGKLQGLDNYENIRKRVAHGTSESWYESGQLESHREYSHGQATGQLRFYYPDGHLKREETYATGKRLTGQCYAPNGQAIPFFEYLIMPVYSKGNGSPQAIVADISQHFVYPKDARRAAVQGRIFVSFDVTIKGRVTNVQVRQGLFPSIDAEAVRVVEHLARFTPGRKDGKVAQIRYTVPIALRLQ